MFNRSIGGGGGGAGIEGAGIGIGGEFKRAKSERGGQGFARINTWASGGRQTIGSRLAPRKAVENQYFDARES